MTRFMLVMAAAFCVTSVAQAQTPDGETPAEETVCDSQEGRSFGLCNAYCEAKDCDAGDDNGNGCESLLDQWTSNTKEDMPCLAGGCLSCDTETDWRICRSLGGYCDKSEKGTVCLSKETKSCVDTSACTTCRDDADVKYCAEAGGKCGVGTFCRSEKLGCIGFSSRDEVVEREVIRKEIIHRDVVVKDRNLDTVESEIVVRR